jgi:hypothetical protein
MPISFQPANKAELRVDIGQTSLEALQKFQSDAAVKGGGQLRAKANEDGSYTLYVPANTKFRLSGLFSGYGKEERTQKQELAKDLVKEILTRRLPQEAATGPAARELTTVPGKHGAGAESMNRWNDPVGARTAELLKNIDKYTTVSSLGYRLSDAEKLSASQTTSLAHNVDPTPFQSLDGIMAQPHMRAAFGRYMEAGNVGETFDFMNQVDALKQATTPQAKIAIAREIVANRLPQGSETGRPAGSEAINIASKMTAEIEKEVNTLVGKSSHSPADLARLDQAFDPALSIMKGFIPTKHSSIQPVSIQGFMASPQFQEGLGAIGADQAHAKLGSSVARQQYVTGGQLDSDVQARLPAAVQGGTADRIVEFNTAGTFRQALTRPDLHAAFMQHLGTEYSQENLNFYDQTTAFHEQATHLTLAGAGPEARTANLAALQGMADAAKSIMNQFVSPNSPEQVNLPSAAKNPGGANSAAERLQQLRAGITALANPPSPMPTAVEEDFQAREGKLKNDLQALFEPNRDEIAALMLRDSAPRAAGSAEFARALEPGVTAEQTARLRDQLVNELKDNL